MSAVFLSQQMVVGSTPGITITSQVISHQWVSEASHKNSMANNENNLFTLLESCSVFGMCLIFLTSFSAL